MRPISRASLNSVRRACAPPQSPLAASMRVQKGSWSRLSRLARLVGEGNGGLCARSPSWAARTSTSSQPRTNTEQAMFTINHVVLTGRLTRDPRLHPLPSGNSVCELRLAVNTRRREAAGGWVEKPNFFDVVVYGASGENVAKHIHKGGPVAVDGRLDWRKWETKDGRPAQAVRIIARTVQFLSGA